MSDSLVKYEAAADDARLILAEFIVDDDESHALASETLRETKTRMGATEAEFEKMIAPQKAAIDAIRSLKERVMSKDRLTESELKGKIATYELSCRAIEKAALEAAASAPDHGALALIAPLPQARGISVREIATFEYTDKSLVPRQYCEPSDKLVRAAAKLGMAIPGVRVFNKASVTARKF